MTVWKYPIPLHDHLEMLLPSGAQVLKVECQHEQPCLWALVNPGAPEETRHFRIAGTGHVIIDKGLSFVSTFQMDGGALVFHVFEIKP